MLCGNTTIQSTVVPHVNTTLLVGVSVEPSYYGVKFEFETQIPNPSRFEKQRNKLVYFLNYDIYLLMEMVSFFLMTPVSWHQFLITHLRTMKTKINASMLFFDFETK